MLEKVFTQVTELFMGHKMMHNFFVFDKKMTQTWKNQDGGLKVDLFGL